MIIIDWTITVYFWHLLSENFICDFSLHYHISQKQLKRDSKDEETWDFLECLFGYECLQHTEKNQQLSETVNNWRIIVVSVVEGRKNDKSLNILANLHHSCGFLPKKVKRETQERFQWKGREGGTEKAEKWKNADVVLHLLERCWRGKNGWESLCHQKATVEDYCIICYKHNKTHPRSPRGGYNSWSTSHLHIRSCSLIPFVLQQSEAKPLQGITISNSVSQPWQL